MQIDWFTVLAQLINFVVLIWILHRLLYAPIISLIAKRETEIADRLARAARLSRDAEDELNTLAMERESFEQRREGLLLKTKQEAAALADEISQQARDEIEGLRVCADKRLVAKKTEIARNLANSAAVQIGMIAKHCLTDLADRDLEQAMARRFARVLGQSDPKTTQQLARSLEGNQATLISHCTLEPATRETIEEALERILPEAPSMKYKTDCNMSPGLVLQAKGKEFGWTVDTYLAGFEQNLLKHLETNDGQSNLRPLQSAS